MLFRSEEYAARPGQEANALDSLGEAYYLNGRFEEAEKQFQASYAKDPNMNGGLALSKAAYARLLRRDGAGADQLHAQFTEARKKAKDPSIILRDAMWWYSTGRRDRALQALPTGPDPVAARLRAVWSNPALASLPMEQWKQLFERTTPSEDGTVRTFYAEALLKAGKREEAKQLVRMWPLPEGPGDPTLTSQMLPRFLAVRAALVELQ